MFTNSRRVERNRCKQRNAERLGEFLAAPEPNTDGPTFLDRDGHLFPGLDEVLAGHIIQPGLRLIRA